MAKKFSISHKGENLGNFELVKRCICSSGYVISLFRAIDSYYTFIVAVKRDNETVEFKRFTSLSFPKLAPFEYYINMIACYA